MPEMPLKDDGGPAFPFNIDGNANATMFGMSIADYFAAAAIQGIMANSIPGSHHAPDEAVRLAWELADLMIEARARRNRGAASQ